MKRHRADNVVELRPNNAAVTPPHHQSYKRLGDGPYGTFPMRVPMMKTPEGQIAVYDRLIEIFARERSQALQDAADGVQHTRSQAALHWRGVQAQLRAPLPLSEPVDAMEMEAYATYRLAIDGYLKALRRNYVRFRFAQIHECGHKSLA